MKGTRAARSRATSTDVLAICIRDSTPSCMRAPPDAETTTSPIRFSTERRVSRASFSPTTDPHRASHEAEVHHGEVDRHPVQPGIPAAERLERPCLPHGGLQAVPVALEVEGIGGPERAVELVPRAFVHQQVDVLLRADAAVMAPGRADRPGPGQTGLDC